MFRSLKSLTPLVRTQMVSRAFSKEATSSVVPFHKILIANRGEIACRIIRTAKSMGIKTVAVYSDVDRHAEHVKMADEAVHIGGAPPTESYLIGENILKACKSTGAQAVHPGYGFLSENLEFCQLLTDNNIEFIGPPPDAIRAMGSKSESKEIMISANVPVVPGYHGENQDDEHLFTEAKRVGYPLMIKACLGGGGKGMRAVEKEEDFMAMLDACRREALKGFGDDSVLIEKLVQAPRHVELQVFGDKHGDAVHLLERDCSIQRRHQKVLEEAPAPNLTPDVRKRMGDAAVACAKATGYVGAGTVEFLVDSVTNDFYFCEMNTRLQVEHPVSEIITGVDLVEWQLRIAAGEKLPYNQEQILERASTRGCALEARIYAENPLNDFLPQTGHLHHLRTPVEISKGGLLTENTEENVRVDSGIISGNAISSFYDPMISKLIVHGKDRAEAIRMMERALRNYQVAGLSNNIDFVLKIVQHDGFKHGSPTTAFFEEHIDGLLDKFTTNPSNQFLDEHTLFGLTALNYQLQQSTTKSPQIDRDIWGPGSLGDWRIGGAKVNRSFKNMVNLFGDVAQEVIVSKGADAANVNVQHIDGEYEQCIRVVKIEAGTGADHSVGSRCWDMSVEINGILVNGTTSIHTNLNGDTVIDTWLDGKTGDENTHAQVIIPHVEYTTDGAGSGTPMVKAPMPGQVVKCLVKSGDIVKSGDPVCILNAMKMEHVVNAPSDGVISLACDEGDMVMDGAVLAEILAPAEE